MLEILSPAGSPEGVTAAVQNGADAIYLGYSAFNARQGAKNFTPEDFSRAAEYCRVRGVSVYLALNALISDSELHEAVQTAISAVRAGADAIIVSDLGLLRALRRALPETPLHCGANMNIHSAEGVRIAAAMGASRVVLAQELTRDELKKIAKEATIEIEVMAHGGSCMSFCGQCYMSAVAERKSANRGMCTHMCRRTYGTGGRRTDTPLSLRDSCLVSHVEELEKMGIRALKIEGRERRPEYAAVVTGIYSRAVRQRREPTDEELRVLVEAFSTRGLTDGFYDRKPGEAMLSIGEGEQPGDQRVYHTARKNYLSGEFQRVPVRFAAELKAGRPARLVAADDRHNTATATGDKPEPAFHKVTDSAVISTALHRTEGTPFYCAGVKSVVQPDLVLSSEAFGKMRRAALSQLMEKRRPAKEPVVGEYAPELTDRPVEGAPLLTVSVMRAAQLSKGLLEARPDVLYLPVSELRHTKLIRPFAEEPGIKVAAALPRVVHEHERGHIFEVLEAAKLAGIDEVLVSNIGHILPLRERGFRVRGDYGLNIFSSHALIAAQELGLQSAMLSFEMNLDQIRQTAKPIDTEVLAYGRLPLMHTEKCVIKAALGMCSCGSFRGLTDDAGANYPVLRETMEACRNVVFSPRKLFLADRVRDFVGVWGLRLAFSTENADECASVMRRYRGVGTYEPGGVTRGLYYRRLTP